MIQFPGLCGASHTNRFLTINAERTINYYIERAGGNPKADPNLVPTPGIHAGWSIGTGPVRGLFAQDNRAFGVGGTVFGELLTNHGVMARGSVRSGGVATISSNGQQGHQVFITAGGYGYIYDLVSNAFGAITDPEFPQGFALQGLFFDGYFIVLDSRAGAFQLSKLYDGLTWNALDFATVNAFSDQIISMTRTHDNLWAFGSRNTQPYYNSGDANFPFVPIPSALIEHGTGAAFACVEVDNAPMWLGQDAQGGGMVWRANGYTPVRVSSHALERQLLTVPTSLSQSLAWSYQEQGHTFYVLYVPGLDTTWAYDIATGEWCERAEWDPDLDVWLPHRAVNHAYCWGQHLVGDRLSGTVYQQSLEFAFDEMVA